MPIAYGTGERLVAFMKIEMSFQVIVSLEEHSAHGTAARSAVGEFGRLGTLGGLGRSHISLLFAGEGPKRKRGGKKGNKRKKEKQERRKIGG